MQLILDGDTDIDIKRNMSTIEGESLSEKFLTNKIIEHLADDISNGNKENIQKKDNVIPEQAEEDVIETDKNTSSKNIVVKTNGQDLVDDKEVQSEVEGDKNTVVNIQIPENVGDAKNEDKINEKIEDAEINVENVGRVENEIGDGEKEAKVVEDEKNKTENVETVEISNSNLEPAVTEVSESNKSAASSVDIEQVTNNKISDNLDQEESQNTEHDTLIKTDNIADCVKEIDNEDERDIITIENSTPATESSNERVIEEEKNILVAANKIEVNSNIEDDSKIEDLEIKSNQNEVPKDLNKTETVMDCSEEILIGSETDTDLSKPTPIEIDDEDIKIEEEVELNSESHSDKYMGNKPEPQETDVTTISQEDETGQNGSEAPKTPPRFCKLSNNLDIFSDEEEFSPEEPTKPETPPAVSPAEKQCISIDDDDDIMLIDEELNAKDNKNEVSTVQEDSNCSNNSDKTIETPETSQEETKEKIADTESMEEVVSVETDTSASVPSKSTSEEDETSKVLVDKPQEPDKIRKPLLASNFVKTCKKNLVDMTRNDLEEFCILKIVESIVNRSNLGEIKAQLKTLSRKMERYKHETEVLAKQNRDLQFVLKSVQEEVKSGCDLPITPIKITRSVGMQIFMADKVTIRKKPTTPPNNGSNTNNKQPKNQPNSNTRNQKMQNMQIPVPRLVPANSPVAKANQISQVTNISTGKHVAPLPNGVKNSPPTLKAAEKRVRVPSATVDLTDDEPPAKLSSRGTVSQGLRVLPPSNLLASQRPAFPQSLNSPRKVYIPISGPGQTVRPGQTIMLRAVGTGPTPRQRCMSPHLNKVSPNTPAMRLGRMQSLRHPGPLPEALKQCQPPNWKALPPAPDIKLAKVENGIVISWKIEGFVAENYEDIASFQLYAYQESTLPPSTNLWKKIGDVKALPLPMACTLTQFMPGYKYYFAVRAVDVKTRLGPFSLPASILLLNST